MATTENNLADRSGSLVESHRSRQPRVFLFYFLIAALLLLLAGGLVYQQLFKSTSYHEVERVQNQRRILVPGPRGNIYDRNGELLVGNRPRLAIVLYLGELRRGISREYVKIRIAYRESGDKGLPTDHQMRQIARTVVVQRYLDQVNTILGRDEKVDREDLERHFARQLLLPYTLMEDLEQNEYARLIERLPVRSPLQLYTSSMRYYPYGSAAAHTLGYVGTNSDIAVEDFPGEDLKTFKMKGTTGRDGLEKQFDEQLQGEAGGTIFRVDPAGYKINPPLSKRLPVQGHNLTTSLDIDLQLAAEDILGDQVGGAVALDIKTGEVLVLASKPDYNLSDTAPRISDKTWQSMMDRNALLNRAIGDAEPPGSTFKILTTIAGLRSGRIVPDQPIVDCQGTTKLGSKTLYCDNGRGRHGEVTLSNAIASSCDIYYYEAGRLITPDRIAEEGRRFHLDRRTGIELPLETSRMLIPDTAWKERTRNEKWYPGDTANMAIGQGDVLATPLGMACFVASVARNEVFTQPTLLHNPNAPVQHTEPIGLTTEQRTALIEGMAGTVTRGTARGTLSLPIYQIPGVRIAAKTGTAQKTVVKEGKLGKINYAWFICFAPADKPEIAVAVMIEGETLGESFEGGRHAAPVAVTILKKYFEKKNKSVAQMAVPAR